MEYDWLKSFTSNLITILRHVIIEYLDMLSISIHMVTSTFQQHQMLSRNTFILTDLDLMSVVACVRMTCCGCANRTDRSEMAVGGRIRHNLKSKI